MERREEREMWGWSMQWQLMAFVAGAAAGAIAWLIWQRWDQRRKERAEKPGSAH
ncbi:hypothetical protein LA345_13330 [Burkholderia vietnamiensis]|nr:hypothetical protein [Burkholderia vietnamiensis]